MPVASGNLKTTKNMEHFYDERKNSSTLGVCLWKGWLYDPRACSLGCGKGECERDMRSADKMCFFLKEIGFWFDIYIFRSRKIQDLRVENWLL